jgi:hypothetical protein
MMVLCSSYVVKCIRCYMKVLAVLYCKLNK